MFGEETISALGLWCREPSTWFAGRTEVIVEVQLDPPGDEELCWGTKMSNRLAGSFSFWMSPRCNGSKIRDNVVNLSQGVTCLLSSACG
jgi:hypothetical protein